VTERARPPGRLQHPPAGALLREWRARRRLSQLDLATLAGTSSRHLSYVETGRSTPSREMVLRLADTLALPLAACNQVLLGAGHAPAYQDARADPAATRRLLETLDLALAAYEPWPALVLDAAFDVVVANAAVDRLLALVDPDLLDPPVNVIRPPAPPAAPARGRGPLPRPERPARRGGAVARAGRGGALGGALLRPAARALGRRAGAAALQHGRDLRDPARRRGERAGDRDLPARRRHHPPVVERCGAGGLSAPPVGVVPSVDATSSDAPFARWPFTGSAFPLGRPAALSRNRFIP